MSKQPTARWFCPSGWNGRSRHAHATVSAATCVRKSRRSTTAGLDRHARNLSAGVLALCLLLVAPAFADQANVFVYHRFSDARHPSTNISREDFRAQLELLQREQFTLLRLGEVIAKLQQGISLPPRCAVITVDDAYRSFLTDGWPLLREFGFPATLFVSTDAIGGGDYLTWQELERLQGEGVEIGNHSASHAYLLDRLPAENQVDWAARVTLDLMRSQQAFREHLDMSPQLFAYPYGEFTPSLAALVQGAGFVAAFGQQSGVLSADQDVYSLPRFPVGGDYGSLAEFRSKLAMKPLPVRVVSPQTTLVTLQNPPVLTFTLSLEGLAADSLRCFVPGPAECSIKKVSNGADLYQATASQPLAGRRSKYTVTAAQADGRAWFWYSQLWVLAGGRE